MAFFDKLGDLAKNISDKTSDAIEITKLNSKIAAEQLAANEELLKAGQYYYERYLAGEAEEAVTPHFQNAKAHLDTVSQLQAEVERIKAENEAAKAAAAPAAATQHIFCSNCGTQLPAGTHFCNNCGTQLP